jgi:hypothetical protein
LDLDYEVLCVDNFYTGTKHNVEQLLAEHIIALTGTRSKIEYEPLPQDAVQSSQALPYPLPFGGKARREICT